MFYSATVRANRVTFTIPSLAAAHPECVHISCALSTRARAHAISFIDRSQYERCSRGAQVRKIHRRLGLLAEQSNWRGGGAEFISCCRTDACRLTMCNILCDIQAIFSTLSVASERKHIAHTLVALCAFDYRKYDMTNSRSKISKIFALAAHTFDGTGTTRCLCAAINRWTTDDDNDGGRKTLTPLTTTE